MKKILIFIVFVLLSNNIFGQAVLVRPGSSIGYFSANDASGLSYTYGVKILLMANESQRYGIIINRLNILSHDRMSYLSTGIFIEQILFRHFNMGIGTVGYINTIEWGENPFGLYSHLGFEYNFNHRFGIVAAYQSELIFRRSISMNNAFSLELGFRF